MTNAVKKYRIIGLVIAALIFITDQFSKYMIMFPLDLRAKGQIVLLPFFNLTWAENYGVSMGMLTASSDFQRWALVALTGLIACAVLIWMFRETAKWDILALSLVLGGALGNIVDRAMHGYVVDFLDLHIGGFRPFLIFNVADACISIGVVILLARALLLRDKSTEASD
ncbi:signal peptidase II [Parasphingorhabdus sp.]|uniref:signal peptidase II n=1 Tax=Parasphingorhabdus sp. TaxID=2709688 RepID=UPI0032679429